MAPRLGATTLLTLCSNRMYNRRFRQWNIFKYLKISDKNEMLKECGGSIKQVAEQVSQGRISVQDYRKTVRWYRSTQPSYPSRSMSLDPKHVNPELIFRSLHDYHHWLADFVRANPTTDNAVLALEPSRESNDLWLGIIEGVRSLALTEPSVERYHRSFSLLRQVGSLAAPAMTSRPFDFISELLVELTSPMSVEWTEIRCIILRLFGQEASRALSPIHPIAIICREMVKANHLPEVATKSLSCMLSLATKLWGEHSIMVYKVRKASYVVKLKERNVLLAEKEITQLLDLALQLWGRRSLQARDLHLRFGQLYILMVRLTDHATKVVDVAAVGKALEHLHEAAGFSSLLEAGGTMVPESVCREDEIGMQATGDIGVCYELMGDMDLAMVWYRKVADVAIRTCGSSSNTSHWATTILVSVLRSQGKNEEAESWEARISPPE
jgi:hypothetical protein